MEGQREAKPLFNRAFKRDEVPLKKLIPPSLIKGRGTGLPAVQDFGRRGIGY